VVTFQSRFKDRRFLCTGGRAILAKTGLLKPGQPADQVDRALGTACYFRRMSYFCHSFSTGFIRRNHQKAFPEIVGNYPKARLIKKECRPIPNLKFQNRQLPSANLKSFTAESGFDSARKRNLRKFDSGTPLLILSGILLILLLLHG
jgi:hypothetical protein